MEKLLSHVAFLLEPWCVYALADSGMASTEASLRLPSSSEASDKLGVNK